MLERFCNGWFTAQGLQFHFINFLKQFFFAQNSVTTHRISAKAPAVLQILRHWSLSFPVSSSSFTSASTSGIYFLINKYEQKWAHAVRAARACCMEIHFMSAHLKINTWIKLPHYDGLLANYVISQAGDTFIYLFIHIHALLVSFLKMAELPANLPQAVTWSATNPSKVRAV